MYVRNDVDSALDTRLEKVRIMEKPEWVTLNQAAERPECKVTGETLRQMIRRGDVPTDHWMEVPYGETRKTYYIDVHILSKLDYRTRPGRPKQL